MKKVIISILILGCLCLGWGGYQYYSISQVGEYASPVEADVIIILGAAVWQHGPSPALQARIIHGMNIYKEGLADYIILTGGMGTYPPTEAEVMKAGLISLGVEEEVLFLEDQATSTYENIEFSKEIMEKHQWQTAIIVTDVFHMKRALLMAENQGITTYGAPVKDTTLYRNKALKFRYTLREVSAITYYYIQSFFRK
ncbi:YdcF family protein [Alkaliphilus hydrothermalis]|uniref:Uncharacterized SAM-binding protein YcdF (DUF218 family) n=1 Tax=Alkaliphilus hydrothermalis TaxID=1482730 RepID=A0ABS2NL33_9FIRM|nr:YdcF family protein [Alkaliphilus hydrothermalis]MBM7613645.1 uncharacterized SAM-binding protein YcdF (DUF218 family) [Alkaliphilus hydrothermalis]